MVPAQQRFVARDFAGIEIDHRLVMEMELIAGEHFAQIGLDIAPLARHPVEFLVVKRQRVAALGLGSEERNIRAPHQFFRVAVAIGALGDADAARDAIDLPVEFEGVADNREETMRAFDQHARARARFEQHGEFVPAQPRDEILSAHLLFEPGPNFAQQPVPDQMAAGVVDRLEIVEIEIEQHDVAHSVLLRQRGTQPFVEKVAVGEAGEVVVMRHEGDAVLDQPVVGDVARDPAHPAIAARARR